MLKRLEIFTLQQVLRIALHEKYAQVDVNGVSAVHNHMPELTIMDHQTAVLSGAIYAENWASLYPAVKT